MSKLEDNKPQVRVTGCPDIYHKDLASVEVFHSPRRSISTFPAFGPVTPKPSTRPFSLADYVIITRKQEIHQNQKAIGSSPKMSPFTQDWTEMTGPLKYEAAKELAQFSLRKWYRKRDDLLVIRPLNAVYKIQGNASRRL